MTCRACGSDRLDHVFGMDPMPLAAAFAETPEEAEASPRYPLDWYWCADCGLVNVFPDIPDETLYAHYAYAASTVPALVRHHAEYAEWLAARHGEKTKALEIGCNDGVLLDRLPAAWHRLGIDPSDVALDALQRFGGTYHLIPKPVSEVEARFPDFDVVTSSNAFAHFTAIEDAIEKVARWLARNGQAYIEVHDLDATLASGQWDTIYHEHKVEWSSASLARAFARKGLILTELHRLPLHGGLLRAVFRHGWTSMAKPKKPDFTGLAEAYRRRFESPAYRKMLQGGVAYGAAARASVYLNQLPSLPLDYIVDGSPKRAGKYLPGLGLPIVTPEVFDEDEPRRALITAWNHAEDIMARHEGYRGEWVRAW